MTRGRSLRSHCNRPMKISQSHGRLDQATQHPQVLEVESVMDQSVMDYSVKTTLEKQKPIVKKYLEGAAANAAAATYSYDCTVSLASAAGGYLNVDFKKNGSRFARFEGGFAGGFGGYTGWGKAWFNTPVEDLIGKGGAFVVEVVGITAHV